jgi:hypothetical protein
MLLLLLACARTIPTALQIEDEDTTVAVPEPTDPAARLAWMVGEDPLVRRPRIPTAEVEAPLAAYRALSAAPIVKPTDWADLETLQRGTVAVPLARGARLAGLETALGDPATAVSWLLPLRADKPAQEQVRSPLDAFGGAAPAGLLGIAERQVILGWLDGPTIPLAAPARALAQPTYARVATTPAGALLLRRAEGARDPAAAAAARDALVDATWVAAMRAAADRDTEQRQLKALLAEAATAAGTPGDPTNTLLGRAATGFAADAADDASAGAALLAQAALRWNGGCPDAPCGGFDRVSAMATAGSWHPSVAPLAATWQVIAAKDALDRLEVAYDEPSFPAALDAQVEVLLGTGGAVDGTVLLYPRSSPSVALALARAAGGGDLTSKDDVLRTLSSRVARAARAAAVNAPTQLKEPLLRIAKRSE